mmetsp:Transcript_126113/g.351419  ORF Transcript_126113/g.351419 Transcript_126113/m.351419 type:complete len:380 (-) Transcript_126113:173-1312(-)
MLRSDPWTQLWGQTAPLPYVEVERTLEGGVDEAQLPTQLGHWRRRLRLAFLLGGFVVLTFVAGESWRRRCSRMGFALHNLQSLVEVKEKEKEALWCQGGQRPADLWRPDEHHQNVQVTVLTYNLFWWNLFNVRRGNHGSAGRLIATSGKETPYDIMGLQECEDPDRVLHDAGLSDEYASVTGNSTLCTAYRKSHWSLVASGMGYVAEDRHGLFGRRGAQWLRLRHKSGAMVFFVNHHGPLPINSGGICGGLATAHNLVRLIHTHGKVGDGIVLVGDFNANPHSTTVQELRRYFLHVYSGKFMDGIDNIFSNVHGLQVVNTRNLGGGGSDHDALSSVIMVGPMSQAATEQAMKVRRPMVRLIIRRWSEQPSTNSSSEVRH